MSKDTKHHYRGPLSADAAATPQKIRLTIVLGLQQT
jgi:hypothetical protein